jgi:hypothetical protein
MMTIQDLGALGEIIGGLAVVLSLIYVGSQIRQSTKSTQSQASQAFIQAFDLSVAPLTKNPEFRDLFWRGLSGIQALKGSEIVAFSAWIMVTMRSFESFYYQTREGVFDTHIMEGWINQYADLLGYTGSGDVWAARRHQFGEEFRNYVDELIEKGNTKPLYLIDELG